MSLMTGTLYPYRLIATARCVDEGAAFGALARRAGTQDRAKLVMMNASYSDRVADQED
jgi:hypothetical protein